MDKVNIQITSEFPFSKPYTWLNEGKYLNRGICQGQFEKAVLRSQVMERPDWYWGVTTNWNVDLPSAVTWSGNDYQSMPNYAKRHTESYTDNKENMGLVFSRFPLIMEMDISSFENKLFRHVPDMLREGIEIEGGIPYDRICILYGTKINTFFDRVPKEMHDEGSFDFMQASLDEVIHQPYVSRVDLLDLFENQPDKVRKEAQRFVNMELGKDISTREFDAFIDRLNHMLR